jgi:hypothetical protein
MATVKLPIVIAIAIIAALAGGGIFYVLIPNTDPEVKALLERQVELAEQERANREAAAEQVQDFFSSNPDDYPTSGGHEMQIRRPGQ